ncbi:MAG: phospholipase A [Formivibrio sp.]|nr:phospholipase A [Formivibrio sp.]
MINAPLPSSAKLQSAQRYPVKVRSIFLSWDHRIIAALMALAAPYVSAQTVTECAHEIDNEHRLACYDQLFREHGKAPAESLSAAPIASETPSLLSVSAPPPTAEPQPDTESSALTKFWELTPADKRGTFIVRTHLPNFVLPVHYTSSINHSPSSPTQPPDSRGNHYRPIEAKLQISLRTKVVENFLLPNADLWFAYTQQSLWQVWNSQDSAPFRSTDYQPEAIYVIPVSKQLGTLPGGWHWRMAQLGLAHQSNGQSDPLSRSWNRVYAGVAFDRGEFGLEVKANRRLNVESGQDDNPDLVHYIGNTEVKASWLPGRSTASVTWKTGLNSWGRGSLQLDWTHPIDSAKPEGLRWYVQLFTGYGETLLDYNHRQTTAGVGLTLFQF